MKTQPKPNGKTSSAHPRGKRPQTGKKHHRNHARPAKKAVPEIIRRQNTRRNGQAACHGKRPNGDTPRTCGRTARDAPAQKDTAKRIRMAKRQSPAPRESRETGHGGNRPDMRQGKKECVDSLTKRRPAPCPGSRAARRPAAPAGKGASPAHETPPCAGPTAPPFRRPA